MDIGQSRHGLGRTDGGDYRLGVRDFGSIESADVEFRPLTVFVGPSNTGKSYLATLSYALHRYFEAEADPYRWGIRRLVTGHRTLDRGPDKAAASELSAELASWATNVTEDDDLPSLPGSIAETVRSEIERGDRVVGPLQAEIVRAFGAEDIAELVRRSGSGAATVEVVPSRPVEMGLLGYRMQVTGDQIDIVGNASETVDPLAGFTPREADRWTHLLRHEALRYQNAGIRRTRREPEADTASQPSFPPSDRSGAPTCCRPVEAVGVLPPRRPDGDHAQPQDGGGRAGAERSQGRTAAKRRMCRRSPGS